jgi:hypothetical protein
MTCTAQCYTAAVLQLASVFRHAFCRIDFDDLHSTGLYTWDFLHDLAVLTCVLMCYFVVAGAAAAAGSTLMTCIVQGCTLGTFCMTLDNTSSAEPSSTSQHYGSKVLAEIRAKLS